MDTPNPRPDLIVGNLAEYLAIAAGKVNGIPVGILTFRPQITAPQPLNLMISRAALERLREDIDFLLAHSAFLKDGESLKVSLAEIEAIHSRLG
jgi:hypothetical protein